MKSNSTWPRLTVLLLFGLFFWGPVVAQVPILPDQFRVNLSAGQSQQEEDPVEFFELEYKYATLDLRGLQELTTHKLPSSLVITPPDLNDFDHVVVLVGVSGEIDDPSIIVWLAANYRTNRITLFVDQDQDRDFNNDRGPMRIRRGGEPVSILLSNGGKDQSLQLNPPPLPVKPSRQRRIDNGISVGFSAGLGVGGINYQYEDLTYGHPTTYNVSLVEKFAKLVLSYDLRQFQVGTSLAIQNHFFYTSTLKIKKGEPIRTEIPDPFLPGRTTFVTVENADEKINVDRHSPNRLQVAAYGAYKINVRKSVTLQPMIAAGVTTYFNPEYTRLINESGETYDLKPSLFFEGGLRAEFTIGLYKAFFLEFSHSFEQWEPQDFVAGIPHEGFDSDFGISRFALGYRFKVL